MRNSQIVYKITKRKESKEWENEKNKWLIRMKKQKQIQINQGDKQQILI